MSLTIQNPSTFLGDSQEVELKFETASVSLLSQVKTPEMPLYLEYLIRSVPSVVFLICAYIRFKKIQSIGFNKTIVYSRFFNVKWSL